MQWCCKLFNELSLEEFHQILKLRIDVFVVEQECAYHELDNKDEKAFHLFRYSEDGSDMIIAYARIFKPGDYYKEASFGRVVVHPNYRKNNLGKELVNQILKTIKKEFRNSKIKISGQTYLKNFYESFGFKVISEEYLDDGIPHLDMLKS